MASDRIQQLLIRYFNEECSLSEKRELALWIHTLGNEKEWERRLREIWEQYQSREKPDAERVAEILKEIVAEEQEEQRQTVSAPSSGMLKWTVAAAAVIAALIVLSLVYFVPNPNEQQSLTQKTDKQTNEILPGSNKATLTLANGQKIILDSLQNGILAAAGNPHITKVKNGVVSFKKSEDENQIAKISYNTISTPRGGQYQIILSDGSKIWLNAASSLRFPTVFTAGKREIFVEGEVYAEIVPNKDNPFIVHIQGLSGVKRGIVKVLGTSFNINAYRQNVPVKATLLDGSVKVESNNVKKILKPGEQALILQGGIQIHEDIDANSIIAWKNGLFDFSGNDIEEVMQRIARWYDVDVHYVNKPSAHFMGTISRTAKVSDVLKMLEMTGAVHFKIEGKTITVKK